MGPRDRVTDDLALVGDRGDEGYVGQMSSAGVRIVDGEDFARFGVAVHEGRDGIGHRTKVDRGVFGLGDHAALRVEERRRAVAPLLDVRRVGAPDQDGPHLLGDAGQSAGQHSTADSGESTFTHLLSSTSVPTPSPTPRHPGLTTHVDSLNSTMAGPSTSEPSPNASRSSTGTSIHSPSKLASRSSGSA